MKTIILLMFTILSVISYSQNSIFEQKMTVALDSFASAKNVSDFIATSYQFDQIANVETKNWLPLYYHAMCYIWANYNEKREDASKKDAHLDIAQQSIEKIKLLAPKESEIYALEALYFTARLTVNPMERGQKFSGLAQGSIAKSLALNPENIRAKQLKISNEYGTAQFFGSDTAPICERAQALLSEWDNYKPISKIHPNWGKEYLEYIAKSCQTPETDSETSQNHAKDGEILTIKISNLVSDEGVILAQLLDENHKVLSVAKGTIDNKNATVEFDGLKKGVYAVRYFHDANSNMKMDTDKYGRPTEGYGYSNNAKGFMSAPKIKKTLFNLNGDLTLSLKTRN